MTSASARRSGPNAFMGGAGRHGKRSRLNAAEHRSGTAQGLAAAICPGATGYYSCGAGSTSALLRLSMSEPPVDIRAQLDAVYRAEAGRILATLIRLLGDFDLAEDAMHDAFSAALHRWPVEGVPANPRAWLVSAGRFKAIDAMRRRTRFEAAHSDIAETLHGGEPASASAPRTAADDELPDDQLKLIFTCCHPALAPDARAALTLREVCGLTTEEI